MIIGLAESCMPEDAGVMRSYVDAVRRGGHLPLIFPATTSRAEVMAQLNVVDMLMLLGGGDVAAAQFGAQPTVYDAEPNLMRDAYELLLMDVAVEMRKPVFGICRGLQLINVYFGGTNCQDLPTQWQTPAGAQPLLNHSRPDKKWEPVHKICIDSQSKLSKVLQMQQVDVNSTHHQAVGRLGKDLRAVAWSADGVIEAIESTLYPMAAVQFHPERLAWGDDVIMTRLFSHCSDLLLL